MATRSLQIAAVLLLVALAACGGDSTGASRDVARIDGEVTAVRAPAGVRVTNATTVPIAYVVSNRGWLGLLASCASAECPTLDPGQEAVVPFASIYGGETGGFAEALVLHWPVLNGKAREPASQIVVTM